MIGIPYASAEIVGSKVFRVCPFTDCGERFEERFDPKADMGCGAMVSGYQEHYAEKHEGQEP